MFDLTVLCGMWDLSSLTRDSLLPWKCGIFTWNIREVPEIIFDSVCDVPLVLKMVQAGLETKV